jgi:two-component system OmpR family sensor kinase/two-component system sensor histidine kinase BaeS
MTQPELQGSVSQIRFRLLRLLMQAYALVVLLTFVLLIGLFLFVGIDDAIRFGAAVTLGKPLQSYYIGHGSWEGIGDTLEPLITGDLITEREWQYVLLLDSSDIVLIDRGRTDSALVGQTYTLGERDRRVALTYNGQTIGFLITQAGAFRVSPRYLGILAPTIGISFFTGALTFIIGFLLMRRFVDPLADVIGAAQAVAAGDLTTRVPDRVRGSDDMQSLVDSFNHMADALERNDTERRNFLADIAHELRTPLTVIRGRLEGILDQVYPSDEAHVAPVLEETYVLERLVEDLRLLTLAESRQLHFDKQPVQLGDLAERAVDLFRAEADEKEINLSVAVEADMPTVTADPQRVGQVIGNLISNALRYVPANGSVLVTVSKAGTGARLSVRDNGPGVPEEALPKLFDRFWRWDKSRVRAEGGAGLGLAIARQLVEAQGGKITAATVAGGGLEVTFVL